MAGTSTEYRLKNWLDPFSDLLHLVFPRTCFVCKTELASHEKTCCSVCLEQLPYTHYEKMKGESPVDKLFWGRVQLEACFSLLHFEKDSPVQELLHRIKYGSDPQLALEMGKLIGRKVKEHKLLNDSCILLPVPVHHQKRFARGYNQSEMIALGISHVVDLPMEKKLVSKKKHTGSQTRKNRFLRWDNVAENFVVTGNPENSNSHYVIIDDVITTGATIESMILTLKENYPELRFSVISLAVTK